MIMYFTTATVDILLFGFALGQFCPQLPPLEHGGTYSEISSTKVRINCPEPYMYTSNATYVGLNIATRCLKGNWTDPEPTCTIRPQHCEPPKKIEYGNFIIDGNYEGGTVVEIRCDPNYVIEGHNILTCLDKIYKWDYSNSKCIEYKKPVEKLAKTIDEQFEEGNKDVVVDDGFGSRAIGEHVGRNGLDVIFVMDKSNSIHPTQFEHAINFLKFLVEHFNISNGNINKVGGARLGIISFGDNFKIEMALDDVDVRNVESAKQKLDGMKCGMICGGATNMAEGMQAAKVMTKAMRADASKALFLTSDGVPTVIKGHKLPENHATEIKNGGVEIFTIGIGTEINKTLLSMMSSDPPDEHLFFLDGLFEFETIVDIIKRGAVAIPVETGIPAVFPNYTADQCGSISHIGMLAGRRSAWESKEGAWPWLATIFVRDKDQLGSTFACSGGGALICKQWVLTTAACLHRDGKLLESAEVYVVLGEYDLFNDNLRIEQHFYGVKIEVPENFIIDSQFMNNDIALIKLNVEAQLTDYVRMICLPSKDEGIHERPGNKLTLAGWLTMNETLHSKVKTFTALHPDQVSISILGSDDCDMLPKIKGFKCNQHGIFVAAKSELSNGKACAGDRGSPLFYSDNSGRQRLIGLASQVMGCVLADKWAYFTDIKMQLEWIQAQTNNCNK